MSYRSTNNFRYALILLWGLSLLLILLFLGPQRIIVTLTSLTPQDIRDFISSFGLLSALAYILIHAVRPFFFLPVTPFSIAGGFLFGTALGLVLTVIGRLASALITFGVSRYLFRDYIKSRIRGKYAGWDDRLEKGGILYVIVMRMIPMLPFDVVGYVAGVSSISFRKYMIGTFIGDLPGVFVLTFLGNGLSEPGSPQFYLSLLIAIVVAALSWLYILVFVKKRVHQGES